MDLPGVNKENISVDVRENQLIIKAEMKQEYTEEKPQYYRRECRYGSFERRLADEIPLQAHTVEFSLGRANEALQMLKHDEIDGAAVLRISDL